MGLTSDYRARVRRVLAQYTTLLVDYRKRLSAADFDAFVARYEERLLPQLGGADPYLYPFKRLSFWAVRP